MTARTGYEIREGSRMIAERIAQNCAEGPAAVPLPLAGEADGSSSAPSAQPPEKKAA
jgi:hypothetical protein